MRNRIVALILATIRLQIDNDEYQTRCFSGHCDPTQRAILTLLALQSMTPNALAEHFGSSRQAVSRHIKILTECQLVQQKQQGREIYYHFNPQKMQEVDVLLAR